MSIGNCLDVKHVADDHTAPTRRILKSASELNYPPIALVSYSTEHKKRFDNANLICACMAKFLCVKGKKTIRNYRDLFELSPAGIFKTSSKGQALFVNPEMALRESREELAEIFSISLDLICIADINTTTFLKVNPAFTRTLGYSEQELLNRSFLEFTHPDDVAPTLATINGRLQKGEAAEF